MKSHLENIFKIYIDLMNESDNDSLVEAMERIIKAFCEEISPYAFGLIQHFAESF